jgi:hypothetical protein
MFRICANETLLARLLSAGECLCASDKQWIENRLWHRDWHPDGRDLQRLQEISRGTELRFYCERIDDAAEAPPPF